MTHQWLSISSLKGEIEGFILVAQEQSIPARVYQSRILKTGTDPKCRLYTNNDETEDHIAPACPTITNTEYLQRHDRVAKYIHCTLCKHYEIPLSECVGEGKNVLVLWAFAVHTDRKLDANMIFKYNNRYINQRHAPCWMSLYLLIKIFH